MRFIVDLYRYLIFGFCALTIIGLALATFLALDRWESLGVTTSMILVAVGILCVLVLNLGAIAILVSFHDRHVEIADDADRIATALETLVNRGDLAAPGPAGA